MKEHFILFDDNKTLDHKKNSSGITKCITVFTGVKRISKHFSYPKYLVKYFLKYKLSGKQSYLKTKSNVF